MIFLLLAAVFILHILCVQLCFEGIAVISYYRETTTKPELLEAEAHSCRASAGSNGEDEPRQQKVFYQCKSCIHVQQNCQSSSECDS